MRELTRQAARFGAVGLVNTAIGLGAIWGAMAFGVAAIPANIFGYVVGLIISFVLNRGWTFRRGSAPMQVRIAAPRFAGSFVVAWLLNIGVVWIGLQTTVISPYLLQLAGVLTYSVTFFFLCRIWVFSENGGAR